MAEGYWIAGALGVGLLILFGFLLPLIVGDFVDVDTLEVGNFTNNTYNFITNGYDFNSSELGLTNASGSFFTEVTFNLDMVGYVTTDNMQDSLGDYAKILSTIPNIILIPIALVIALCLGYAIVMLIFRLIEAIGQIIPFT